MKEFGTVCCCCTGVLLNSWMGPLPCTLVESTPIGVDEMLRYVLGRLDIVICPTVAVTSHQIPEAWSLVDAEYDFVDSLHTAIIIVGFFAGFLEVFLRSSLSFPSVFSFVTLAL